MMMKMIVVLLLVVTAGSCLADEYTFGDFAVDTGLSGSETSISASANEITDLDGLANNYPSLESLNLGENKISSIETGDFDGLVKLDYLSLTNNQITSLKSGSFDELGNLYSLSFHGNQISSIESGSFKGLNLLSSLVLVHNQIPNIKSGAFDGLDNLRWLDLGGNQITSIESGSFSGLVQLNTLYLDNNYALAGEDVTALLKDIQSLESLFVRGVFYTWSDDVQAELLAWDAIDGHTLAYVPEPGSLLLLGLGGLILARRKA